MELLDVVDDNNNLIGLSEDRKIVHEKNLWHRHVSCWIMNSKGKILLQKRSSNKTRNPNKWSKTGGHVATGESVQNALLREIREELGVKIDKKDIELLGIFKSEDINNRYFGYDFFINFDCPINKYTLQKEEVSKVKYVTIEKMKKLKKNNNKSYTFVKWNDEDFYKTIELLEQKRYKLLRNLKQQKNWKDLYYKNIKKFKSMDDYIQNNLNKKKTYLKQIEKYAKNKKVIECGCGTAKISTYFQNNGYDVSAVDIDNEIIDLAKYIVKNSTYKDSPKFYNMSIMNMNFKNKEFDVAFSNGVLEHFKNDEIIKILKEECRIAKFVIFGVPSKYFDEKEYMYGDERYLTRAEWKNLIKKANASIIDIKSFHSQSLTKRIKNKKIFKQKEFNLFIIKEDKSDGK